MWQKIEGDGGDAISKLTHECQCSPTLQLWSWSHSYRQVWYPDFKSLQRERYPPFGEKWIFQSLGEKKSTWLSCLWKFLQKTLPHLEWTLAMKLFFSPLKSFNMKGYIGGSQLASCSDIVSHGPFLGRTPRNRGDVAPKRHQKKSSKMDWLACMGNMNNISASNCPLLNDVFFCSIQRDMFFFGTFLCELRWVHSTCFTPWRCRKTFCLTHETPPVFGFKISAECVLMATHMWHTSCIWHVQVESMLAK